jgi:hypothetical protein
MYMHPDKTSFIVFGGREQRMNAEKELNNNPSLTTWKLKRR